MTNIRNGMMTTQSIKVCGVVLGKLSMLNEVIKTIPKCFYNLITMLGEINRHCHEHIFLIKENYQCFGHRRIFLHDLEISRKFLESLNLNIWSLCVPVNY